MIDMLYLIAFGLEVIDKQIGERGLVFDDKNARRTIIAAFTRGLRRSGVHGAPSPVVAT